MKLPVTIDLTAVMSISCGPTIPGTILGAEGTTGNKADRVSFLRQLIGQ